MRYADSWDWLLLILSIVLNVVFGVVTPMTSIVFRGIVDVLTKGQRDYDEGKLNIDQFSADIMKYVWGYAGLGAGSFVLNILAVSFSSTFIQNIHSLAHLLW